MEKTDKSAEDILRKHGLGITSILSASGEYSTIDAMHEYAAQQLSQYKETIKELLPLAQTLASTLKWDEEYSGDEVGGKEAQEIVDRAKALHQGSSQVQPPQESEQP